MSQEIYDRGLKIRKSVLGDAYVDNALKNADDFTGPLQDLVTEYCWGWAWGREHLSKRDRSLINLAMISILNRQHELRVRYQFQVEPQNIGSEAAVSEAMWRDCQLTLKYKDFGAGQRYRLETGSIGFYPWARLYDQQANEIARGRTGRCEKV